MYIASVSYYISYWGFTKGLICIPKLKKAPLAFNKMLQAPEAGGPSAAAKIIILDVATILKFAAAKQKLVVAQTKI